MEHLDIVRLRVDVALLCLQALTLLALVAYVIYTAKMARTMGAAYDSQTRPYVVPSVDVLPGTFSDVDLVLENVGHSPALDVVVDIRPAPGADLPLPDGRGLPSLLRDGVAYMPPGWVTGCEWMPYFRLLQLRFTVAVAYWDSRRQTRYAEDYPMDFTGLLAMDSRHRHPLHEIAASIDRLRDDLGWSRRLMPGTISEHVAVYVRSLPETLEAEIRRKPSIWLRPTPAPAPWERSRVRGAPAAPPRGPAARPPLG